tara:strand:- start:821 stop:1042 length:222 start_codon:yes stop_codon:yes gene_type:complete
MNIQEDRGTDICISCGEKVDLSNLHPDSLHIPNNTNFHVKHYGANDSNCAENPLGWVVWTVENSTKIGERSKG